MIESLQQYWYMWLVLAVLIIAAVWAGAKASKAVKKRGNIMKKQREELERFKFLSEKYADLNPELAENSDAKELCEGVTAALQRELEKSENPDAEFANAEKWRREVYALFYFDADCRDSLSCFFKYNEEPLPNEVLGGLESIGKTKLRSLAASMHAMYDDKNESVSLDMNRVAELDNKFKELYNSDEFFESIKEFIINNIGG